MSAAAGSKASPFVDEPIGASAAGQELVSRLIDESPFVQLLTGTEPSAEEETIDAEDPGCAGEVLSPEVEPEFDEEVWSGSADQIAFRDRVLAAATDMSTKQRGAPQRDLRPGELDDVPDTSVKTARETAAAAGRLLAAANADLARAKEAGDADAQRTLHLTANSGYRSNQEQKTLWLRYFARKGGYYDRTQSARERLREGPHSTQACEYMLRPEKKDGSGGFGLRGKIAAPGYSNHQGGIAVDLWQDRIKGHTIENATTGKARQRWRDTWFHGWLKAHAEDHGFRPIPSEEWHWEYRPGATTATRRPVGTVSSDVIRFAQRVLNAVAAERLADDGDLGRRTRAALERFRTRNELGTGGVLDAKTELALTQRALEELAQQSMFTQVGVRDAQFEQALAAFRSKAGLGAGATLDAATRRALTDALARRAGNGATVSEHLGGKLWTFTATTLPLRVAVFCPRAALGRDEVEVLLFGHGLTGGCPGPKQLPSGFITDPPFGLGRIVDASGRPMVLVVPLLDWARPGGGAAFGKGHERWHALGKPQHLGGVLGEVQAELGRVQGRAAPSARELIVAGHSRAHGLLEPLAHLRSDPAMGQGAMAVLSQVWAFDTTYGDSHRVERWTDWLRLNPRLRVHVFYKPVGRTAVTGTTFNDHRRERLSVTPAGEGHCHVPATRLPALLTPRGTADHEADDDWGPPDSELPARAELEKTAVDSDDEVGETQEPEGSDVTPGTATG